MDERKLKKQFIGTAVGLVIVVILLCGSVGFVASEALDKAHEADHVQLAFEAKEYERNINKQIERVHSLLRSISSLYEITDVVDDTQKMRETLLALSDKLDFDSMSIFDLEGNGFFTVKDKGSGERHLDGYHEYIQVAVRQSLQGEEAVSKMYHGEIIEGRVFGYTVPIFHDGKVAGALLAVGTLDIFSDITEGNAIMGGEGFVHILDGYGEFLVRSEKSVVQEKVTTIFDGPYIDEENVAAAKEAFQKRETFSGEFTYRDEKYHFYATPLEFNDWYLFCVSKLWSSAASLGKSAMNMGIVLIALVSGMLFLLCYGFFRARRTMTKMLQLAYYDSVTAAPNTAKFDRDFAVHDKAGKDHAVAALNIHNFKGINDLFGVPGGDRVLVYLSKVIGDMLKPGEFHCRDAADLFYIYLLDTDKEVIENRLLQVIRTVSDISTSYGEYSYDVAVYAGVSVKGDREQALVALQSIKNKRHIQVAFYDKVLHDDLRKKATIESKMYMALEKQEFKMYLQPKFNLHTDELIGAEALVRWEINNETFLFPNEFIPLFEANAFCVKLDMYMVERACEQIKTWMEKGIKPVPISVNQSKLLFSDRNYPNALEATLERYGVPPCYIILEILEGTEAEDLEHLKNQIETLHQKGFKVSMDDFGSGYSSLNMLYQLQIDELKLDRGFLRKVSEEERNRRQILLEQIVNFAKVMEIHTVAEGVETKEDKETIQNLHFDYGQGYFYDKPMPAGKFSEKYME